MDSKIENRRSKIYLTGFMASGKSTVGPLVAQQLGYDFMDLDAAIEEHAGRRIPEIFEEEGEAAFRRMEAEALRRSTQREAVVVALGGGALIDERNLERARQHGLVVYLKAPAEELARRLEAAADERPLVQGEDGTPLSGKALQAWLERLLKERAPFYEQAHVTIETEGKVPEEVAAAVVRAAQQQ